MDEILKNMTNPIELLGYAAGFLFGFSMILQWWVSERRKQSVIPPSFWWTRLVAAGMMFTYGILILKGPVILSQLPAALIYIRNLKLQRGQATT